MWPIVAVAAATALMQYYSSERARGANARRLREMEAEFSRLIPPGIDVSISDPPELLRERIPEPTYDMAGVTPEMFSVIGKYKPEVAPLVLEEKPQLLQETQATREGKDAMRGALQRLKRVGAGEQDPQAMAAQMAAERQAQTAAQSRQQSVMQDFARRGGLTSGMQMGAQMQAQGDLMDRLAMQSQQGAADSYRNSLQALRESASLGRQMSEDDLAFQGRNADVINAFNQRTSSAMRDYNAGRANVMNEAQRFNLGREQDTANSNISEKNKAKYYNTDRADTIADKLYRSRLDERNYQNQMAWDEAKWREAQRQGLADRRQQGFNNQMSLSKGKMGISEMGMAQNMQNAQDRNALYQGLGNAATSAYMYSDEQDRKDERAEKYGYADDYERGAPSKKY